MNHEEALWQLDNSDLSHRVRRMVHEAVALRARATKAPSRAERRRLDDDGCDLLSDAVVEATRIHGVDRYDLVDLIFEVEHATAVNRR
jgi:hypothetical protein